MSNKLNLNKNGFFGTVNTFLKENASTVSMAAGIACIIASLYSAFKASHDISEIHENYVKKVEEIQSEAISDDEKAIKIKEAKVNRNIRYILAYRFVGLFGGGAIGFSLLSKYLDGLTITGLTALAMSKEDEIKTFIKNGKEMLGEEKFKELEDKVLEDRIAQKFFGDGNAVRLSPRDGRLHVDTDSAVIFQINEKDLEEVLKNAEEYCARNHCLSQSKFLEMIGFANIEPESREKWWGPNNMFKAHIGRRSYLGADIASIEYDNGVSCSAEKAGIPGFGKKGASK